MTANRTLKLVLVAAAALLASGTTFAWAVGIVGGHRVDRIGTFEPAPTLLPNPAVPGSATTTSIPASRPTNEPTTGPTASTDETTQTPATMSGGTTADTTNPKSSTTDRSTDTEVGSSRLPTTSVTDDDRTNDHDDDNGVTTTTDDGRSGDD